MAVLPLPTSNNNHNVLRNFPRSILLTSEPEHHQSQELSRDPHIHAIYHVIKIGASDGYDQLFKLYTKPWVVLWAQANHQELGGVEQGCRSSSLWNHMVSKSPHSCTQHRWFFLLTEKTVSFAILWVSSVFPCPHVRNCSKFSSSSHLTLFSITDITEDPFTFLVWRWSVKQSSTTFFMREGRTLDI